MMYKLLKVKRKVIINGDYCSYNCFIIKHGTFTDIWWDLFFFFAGYSIQLFMCCQKHSLAFCLAILVHMRYWFVKQIFLILLKGIVIILSILYNVWNWLPDLHLFYLYLTHCYDAFLSILMWSSSCHIFNTT